MQNKISQSKFIIQKKFVQQIMKQSFVQRIILYGSRARGDNKERSDIDLAIDCSGGSMSNWLTIIDIVDDADTLLGIDCVRYDELSLDNPLRRSIDTEGLILFTRD